MCVGSEPEAPEIEPTSQEITAAKQAVDKYNERHTDGYVGLEQDAITDSKLDHTEKLRGFGSAELAKQEGEAYQLAGATRKGIGFGDVGNAVGESVAAMNNTAEQQGLQIKDAKTMGVIGTGQDRANLASGAVMTSARNSLRGSLADLEAELMVQDARYKSMGKILETGSAIAGYHLGKKPEVQDEYNIVNVDPNDKETRPLTYNELKGARTNPYGTYGYQGLRVG